MIRTLSFAMLGLALLGSPARALVSERIAAPLVASPDQPAEPPAGPVVRESRERVPAMKLPVGEFGDFGQPAPAAPAASEIDGAFGCADEESGIFGILTPAASEAR